MSCVPVLRLPLLHPSDRSRVSGGCLRLLCVPRCLTRLLREISMGDRGRECSRAAPRTARASSLTKGAGGTKQRPLSSHASPHQYTPSQSQWLLFDS